MKIDLEHYRREGWVLVEDAVPDALLEPVVDLICDYWQVDRYQCDPTRKFEEVINGIVPVHQHQAMWDIRQWPTLYKAFSKIHDTEKLWVSMDRLSYKPTVSQRLKKDKGAPNAIHIDMDLRKPRSYVQGVVYLTDTPEERGAWECVPEIFREIRDGKRASFRWAEDVSYYEIVRVPAKAGSIVIWDSRTPHGSGFNWSDIPRFAQYVTMNPIGDEAERKKRVDVWQRCQAPDYWRGMPGQMEVEPWGAPAKLTELGEKLLGVKTWE
ncbi:MAG: phytanoyl-CoA dioxygenase family protein [Pseudomonadota bacterium]